MIININYMNQIIFLSVTFTAVSVFFATFVVTKLFFLVNRLGDSNFFIIDKLVWKSKIFYIILTFTFHGSVPAISDSGSYS